MAREFAITLYLCIFYILFNLFKICPQKKKTIGVASFGDNVFYTMNALKDISEEDLIILKIPSCKFEFDSTVTEIIPFNLNKPISYLKSIYHLATATNIVVDNYFGFLAVTKFRPNTTCVQLWHAAGAIKQFGLKDPTNENRSKKAMTRFNKVYNNFHYSIVASENMALTFQESFGVTSDRILRTGLPRTDIYFNNLKRHQIIQDMQQQYPDIVGKKIILYAPTFRNNQLANYQLELDIEKLYEELSHEYVLFIKPHPAVHYSFENDYSNFVYDVSHSYDTNHLLLITDILISDYSSIPFEYALLEKPMVFFAYDLEEYKLSSGLIEDYENQMPGPIVSTTEAVINKIKEGNFDYQKIQAFAEEWNEYSNGKSSLKLARFLADIDEVKKEKVYV